MYVRQTIEIRPNNKQKTYFRRCFGARRLAYNYGLSEWIRLRDSGQKTNVRDIRTTFNARKSAGMWPFLKDISNSATCYAFEDLKRAFENFFNDSKKIGKGNNQELFGYPQHKGKSYNSGSYTEYFSTKNGQGGAFLVDHRVTAKTKRCSNGNCNTRFTDHPKAVNANEQKPYLRLPRIGTVRLTRPLRYEGRPVCVTIRQHNERFYACFMVEITEEEFFRVHPRYAHQPTASVGIDLGIKELAVTSDGIVIENRRHMERQLEKENRLQERMNHCQRPGTNPSRRFLRAKLKLWKHHTHVRYQRDDVRNKLCAAILANYQHIGIETLAVKKMGSDIKKKKSKRKLNLHLNDVSLYEIRHRIETLGELLGRDIVLAREDYPSTRRCSRCGHIEPPMDTKVRTYHCSTCGNTIDRDLNAAFNLLQLTGRGTSSSTPEADCSMRSDLIRSDIKHRQIGNG